MNKIAKRKQYNYNQYGLRKMRIIDYLNDMPSIKEHGFSGGKICLDLFRYMRSERDSIDDVIAFTMINRNTFYLWTDTEVYRIEFRDFVYTIDSMPRSVYVGSRAMHNQEEDNA